jgi:hypothetical protein
MVFAAAVFVFAAKVGLPDAVMVRFTV